MASAGVASAQTKSAKSIKQQKAAAQREIRETAKKIKDNKDETRRSLNQLNSLTAEIGDHQRSIDALNVQLEAINNELRSVNDSIAANEAELQRLRTEYGKAIRKIHAHSSSLDKLMFVFESESFHQALRRMRYLRQYSDWRKQEAIELEKQRVATAKAKDNLVKTREDRQVVLANIKNERELLTKKKQKQELALADLKRKSRELHAELEKDQKQHAEVQRKIQQMIDEERRKAAEEERKRQEEERRKKEAEARKKQAAANDKAKSAGTTAKTQSQTAKPKSQTAPAPSSNTALTGSFRSNKGKLPYPVDTGFAFLRHYKEKNDGNVSISLSTPVGANACAVFEGVVLRCSRSSDDYTVIIKHGDYMSVYSNLSSVSVKEGQKVKIRQAIGKIKQDVNGRRGELMFWIYGKTDAENPELWLKR